MRSALAVLSIVVAGAVGAACSSGARPATSTPSPNTSTRTPPRTTVVRETVTVADPATAQRLARLEIRLLEREAQIDELQTRLDDTRREFVRTLARLQTSTSRAEAASGIAEAEVALQSLRNSAGADGAGVSQVSQLVQEGSAEFNKQNFGGALYLASQAKMLASTYRTRPTDGRGAALRPGETAFAIPVPLKAATRANIREGPGTNFAIVFSAETGDALAGLSYINDWIRVTDDAGRTGWVSRTLVGKRQP